ncbi:MAG: FAD-binding oxidoreductase [Pseudomonadota bacterium]|nr:FAD-binding oxidoreductase [Pseudomonadota bacterium]
MLIKTIRTISTESQPPTNSIPFRSSDEGIESYNTDESRINGRLEGIFFPRNEAEIADLLIKANQRKTPITLRGSGTGLVAGAVAKSGFIISTERMKRIKTPEKSIDKGNKKTIMQVEPGATISEISQTAESAGFFYPVNPTESSSSIGGNINTDASGSRAFKYGSTRHYIEQLRVVLMNGEVLVLQRGENLFNKSGKLKLTYADGQTICLTQPDYSMPEVKNSAGYFNLRAMDFIDLFIGSEGTLGVVSQATLRLLPPPGPVLTGLIFYDSLKEAIDFVEKARDISLLNRQKNGSGLDLRALEFIGRSALDFVSNKYSGIIPSRTAAAILIEQELSAETDIDNFDRHPACRELFTLLGDKAEDNNSSWISFPGDLKHMQRILDFRHAIPESVNQKLRYEKMGTDLIAPIQELEKFVRTCEAIPKKHQVPHAIWGHISKCQLHVNLIPGNDSEYDRALEAYEELARAVTKMGGSVAAEHGIGKTKHRYLEIMYGEKNIAEMRSLKKTFDPLMLLGQNNIFTCKTQT